MSARLVRPILGLAMLGSAFVASAAIRENVTLAQTCDPSYPNICLPAVPDLDCVDIGFTITVIHNPEIGANDPHYLDVDGDGLGCEPA